MTDIMHDWKDRKFIVAEPDLGFSDIIIVLTDYKFWSEHIDELISWCRSTPGVTNEGMTVICNNQHTLTLFLLRWS